jgi:hypothetical protein
MRLAPALLLLPACALAQPADWLGSAPAQVFRQRVVDLALLYDTASGLDPQGLLVSARAAPAEADRCRRVDVTTARGGAVLRQETLRSCGKAHATGQRTPPRE